MDTWGHSKYPSWSLRGSRLSHWVLLTGLECKMILELSSLGGLSISNISLLHIYFIIGTKILSSSDSIHTYKYVMVKVDTYALIIKAEVRQPMESIESPLTPWMDHYYPGCKSISMTSFGNFVSTL